MASAMPYRAAAALEEEPVVSDLTLAMPNTAAVGVRDGTRAVAKTTKMALMAVVHCLAQAEAEEEPEASPPAKVIPVVVMVVSGVPTSLEEEVRVAQEAYLDQMERTEHRVSSPVGTGAAAVSR